LYHGGTVLFLWCRRWISKYYLGDFFTSSV
jgi:hypothetical protein